MGLHLVVQLYGEAGSMPHERMIDCIYKNSEIDFVSKITVLCEGEKLFANSKIRSLPAKGRSSYADLMNIAQESSTKKEITHFAISNTDIFLTQDIADVMEKIVDSSAVAAISRTEMNGRLVEPPKSSQDLWVFKSHAFSPKVLRSTWQQLGIAGCEHLFAMSLYSHGYDIWNPCLDCQLIHNDPSPKIQWADRYYGTYLFLPPCNISDVGSVSPEYESSVARNVFVTGDPSDHFYINRQSPIKLHLCCGDKKISGYFGVDIRSDVNPDIVAAVDNLGMIEDGIVDEIYFCHGLEHVPHAEVNRCLSELNRVLKPGGTLRLALPDFDTMARLYVAGSVRLEHILLAIHGGQDYLYNTHYSSWDFASLSACLDRCGFHQIARYNARDFLPGNYFDWSLFELNGIEASLNVTCVKNL